MTDPALFSDRFIPRSTRFDITHMWQELKLKTNWSTALFRLFVAASVAALSACGGGGSSSSSTTSAGTGTITTPAAASLVLTGSTNAVSSTSPAVLSATLKNSSGVVQSGVVVTFTTAGSNFGTFFPSSGTALTDANGIASITLNPGTVSGADSVTAMASLSGTTVTSNAFGYTATGAGSASKVTLSASATTISANSPATLSATVRDGTGAVVSGALVKFTTTNTGFGTFSPAGGTALTDSTGVARITLLAGTSLGADTVVASATIAGATVNSAAIGFTVTGSAASVAKLGLTTSSNSISASSPATLTATLTDSAGAGIANAVVSFSTQGAGFGTFFPSGGTALTNSAGVATVSLNAGTKIGADTVTASATVNGVTVASSPIGYTVAAAPVTSTAASIQFISATPTNIAIQGIGGQENSAVTFIVRDSNGNPLANQSVTFTTTVTAGNLGFAPGHVTSATAISATDGSVTAQLLSGTVPTPVRVKAVLTNNPSVTAVSSQLVVSTALPHQNGFSLSVSQKNIEAFTIDNISTTFTTILSDRYGNFVPDGTAVTFRTAGGVGSIPASCVTSGGQCNVKFLSAGVRPANGRLVVLATAVGEESFIDVNGNGLYDLGEPFTDLAEAFIDANEDGTRQTTEEFVDFNNNGRFDPADGFFNGVLRAAPSSAPSTINVRNSITLVLSTGGAKILNLPPSISLSHCVNGTAFNSVILDFKINVSDLNNNAMAPGTTVAFTTTNGLIVSTPSAYTVLDDNGTVMAGGSNQQFLVSLKSDATQDGSLTCTNASTTGTLTVTVTSPSGVTTRAQVSVSD